MKRLDFLHYGKKKFRALFMTFQHFYDITPLKQNIQDKTFFNDKLTKSLFQGYSFKKLDGTSEWIIDSQVKEPFGIYWSHLKRCPPIKQETKTTRATLFLLKTDEWQPWGATLVLSFWTNICFLFFAPGSLCL